MNSIIPMQNIDIDYNELVQSDRAHTSLYKDEKIFDDEMEKSITALGFGLRMPAKFQMR